MGEVDDKVGFSIHMLDVGMRKILDAKMKAAGYDDVTLMHGWILKYLYDNREREVYQRDIEKQFAIGRSTVTTIIQLMEKRDLVCRESVEHDARLKRVSLTEKGYQHNRLVEESIHGMHGLALAGLSEEEKAEFLRIAEKIAANLKSGKSDSGMICPTTISELKEE